MAKPSLVEGIDLEVPVDLIGLPSMDLAPANRDHRWAFIGPSGDRVEVPHSPRFVTADLDALNRAAVQGVGIVQMPEVRGTSSR